MDEVTFIANLTHDKSCIGMVGSSPKPKTFFTRIVNFKIERTYQDAVTVLLICVNLVYLISSLIAQVLELGAFCLLRQNCNSKQVAESYTLVLSAKRIRQRFGFPSNIFEDVKLENILVLDQEQLVAEPVVLKSAGNFQQVWS